MGRSIRVLSALAMVAAAAPAGGQEQEAGAFLPEPTAEHRMLREEAGVWDARITAFMGPPGAEPEVSEGVETNRMLGELWLISDFEGSFGGVPFRGHSQIGFDPKADRFVMSWVDTMSTKLMTMTGTYDPATKSLTMTGKAFDPMLDREVDQKTVSVSPDADRKTFTLFMKAPEYGDDWVKFMEIAYTRRAADPAK